MSKAAVLTVEQLSTEFLIRGRWYPATQDISFSLGANETLAIVGESGCGKSITALSILRLLPRRTARLPRGRIMFEGNDLTRISSSEMRQLRGNRISMIFQEPMTSLNPVLTVFHVLSNGK